MDMNTFEEEQKIDSTVATLVYGILAITTGVLYFSMRQTGDEAVAFVSMAPAFVIVVLLFTTLRMKTTVGAEGVRIRTLYFLNRLIRFDEIERAEPVQYRPLMDYGGWGYRLSSKGKAYNLAGNRGVQLYLKNGGRVLIGSQRDDALATAIKVGLCDA